MIEINCQKTLVALKSNNEMVKNAVATVAKRYELKVSFENNYKFLGVYYGTRKFTCEKMLEKINKLWKKLEHILLINNTFIRHNLIRKFYGFNEVVYWLKVQPKYNLWMDKLIGAIASCFKFKDYYYS